MQAPLVTGMQSAVTMSGVHHEVQKSHQSQTATRKRAKQREREMGEGQKRRGETLNGIHGRRNQLVDPDASPCICSSRGSSRERQERAREKKAACGTPTGRTFFPRDWNGRCQIGPRSSGGRVCVGAVVAQSKMKRVGTGLFRCEDRSVDGCAKGRDVSGCSAWRFALSPGTVGTARADGNSEEPGACAHASQSRV